MRYIAAISIKKISDKPGKKANAGDKITYIYNISNKGNVNLTDISVSDNMIKSVRYISGDNNHDNWLNLSEIWVYEGAYTVQESDLCYDIVNTAVVKARDPCNRLIGPSKDTVVVTTNCNKTICCHNRNNLERIQLGTQIALAMGNANAENNRNILSN